MNGDDPSIRYCQVSNGVCEAQSTQTCELNNSDKSTLIDTKCTEESGAFVTAIGGGQSLCTNWTTSDCKSQHSEFFTPENYAKMVEVCPQSCAVFNNGQNRPTYCDSL